MGDYKIEVTRARKNDRKLQSKGEGLFNLKFDRISLPSVYGSVKSAELKPHHFS
jgi:hypothetical protein